MQSNDRIVYMYPNCLNQMSGEELGSHGQASEMNKSTMPSFVTNR